MLFLVYKNACGYFALATKTTKEKKLSCVPQSGCSCFSQLCLMSNILLFHISGSANVTPGSD